MIGCLTAEGRAVYNGKRFPSEELLQHSNRRSQVKCHTLQNQDHSSYSFTLNINPYCSCKKGEIGVEKGLAVESVGGGWSGVLEEEDDGKGL